MVDTAGIFVHLYRCFNARDVESVLEHVHPEVDWANAFEGGHVHGHAGIREYWKRQWAMIDSRAEPLNIRNGVDGCVEVDVHLTARDLDGKIIFDKTGVHLFRLEDGLIQRFDVLPSEQTR